MLQLIFKKKKLRSDVTLREKGKQSAARAGSRCNALLFYEARLSKDGESYVEISGATTKEETYRWRNKSRLLFHKVGHLFRH